MKNILLVYPPFCTPSIPPYSIANLYTFLKNNIDKNHNVSALDLNIDYHNQKFKEYGDFFKSEFDLDVYQDKSDEFLRESKGVYSKNNKLVVKGNNPELFDDLFEKILLKKPDIVALSIVYSSQAFYALAIIKKLNELGIGVVIGGPAVNDKLIKHATVLSNELELLNHVLNKKVDHNNLIFNDHVDFSIFNKDDYFVKNFVIPIQTSTSCYYKQCAFCTHHQSSHYYEFPLDYIKKTIKKSGAKHFFLLDDMVPKKRLLEIAKEFKSLDVVWTCQLKPTKDLDKETFSILYEAGLRFVIWGVESGNDRILKLMKKATNKKDVANVLTDSHSVGIKNGVYIMFGFPTETKEEFLETIDFIKDNEPSIDLVSTSIFGLQKGSPVYNDPLSFGITNIIEEERTVLEPKISYIVNTGLSNKEASVLRGKYKKTFDGINKYPKNMIFFREHLLGLF